MSVTGINFVSVKIVLWNYVFQEDGPEFSDDDLDVSRLCYFCQKKGQNTVLSFWQDFKLCFCVSKKSHNHGDFFFVVCLSFCQFMDFLNKFSPYQTGKNIFLIYKFLKHFYLTQSGFTRLCQVVRDISRPLHQPVCPYVSLSHFDVLAIQSRKLLFYINISFLWCPCSQVSWKN